MTQMTEFPSVDVPAETLQKWQSIVDTMAHVVGVPAGLIMRLRDRDIEVYVSSRTEGNPYSPGDKEHFFDSGLYCETVVRTNDRLLVPDALADENWNNNPDVKVDMISYLGFPILMPDGRPFGTICVLDCKPNGFTPTYERLLVEFKELIESHLALIVMTHELEQQNAELCKSLAEIRSLRGIIPICAYCKSVRNDEGFWQRVEQYLSSRSDATFSHGICPECLERQFGGLESNHIRCKV